MPTASVALVVRPAIPRRLLRGRPVALADLREPRPGTRIVDAAYTTTTRCGWRPDDH